MGCPHAHSSEGYLLTSIRVYKFEVSHSFALAMHYFSRAFRKRHSKNICTKEAEIF